MSSETFRFSISQVEIFRIFFSFSLDNVFNKISHYFRNDFHNFAAVSLCVHRSDFFSGRLNLFFLLARTMTNGIAFKRISSILSTAKIVFGMNEYRSNKSSSNSNGSDGAEDTQEKEHKMAWHRCFKMQRISSFVR